MYQVKCTIEGVVPMLHDRFPLPDPKGKEPTSYEGKDDHEKALFEKAHMDEKGLYLPADNLKMMLVGNKHRTGAAKIQGSRIEKGKGTMYLDFCKACVWIVGEDDPLKVYIEPRRKIWDETYVTSFINATGGRSVSERPMITVPWSLTFEVHVVDDSFKPGKIKEFYETAGLFCGAGAYGPRFGRFIITEWEVIKTKKKAS